MNNALTNNCSNKEEKALQDPQEDQRFQDFLLIHEMMKHLLLLLKKQQRQGESEANMNVEELIKYNEAVHMHLKKK